MKRYKPLFESLLTQTQITNKTWYHFTPIENVESINKSGFKKSHNSIFGSGVYFYGKEVERKDKVAITCKVRLHKTLQSEYIAFPRLYTELTGKRHNGLDGEEKELEKLGYDSVYIADEDWLVVFNPKNVKVAKK